LGAEEAFHANPIGHLVDIYVRISALIKPEEDEIKAVSKEGKGYNGPRGERTAGRSPIVLQAHGGW